MARDSARVKALIPTDIRSTFSPYESLVTRDSASPLLIRGKGRDFVSLTEDAEHCNFSSCERTPLHVTWPFLDFCF
jgi:hypothetical protein